jgi:uncharacterized repeat protein (TIGR01451 family)
MQETVLVHLRDDLGPAEREAWLRSLNATVVGEIPQLGVLSIALPAGSSVAQLMPLAKDPVVDYAEPNAQAWATVLPDDPAWPRQWGPQKISAPLAWDWTLGSPEIVIAVVDSGIDLGHPDLVNQLWINPGEVPHNGLDDDGNGHVDDVWGWHFFHNGLIPQEDNQVADDNGHGTHVAGIAGAQTGNGLGIAGMAGGSRLMAVKVLNQAGLGWYFDIAQGIVYAVDNGARIVNVSLGGSTPSETLQAAADYAWAHGALVIASAGNDSGAVLYPAACDGTLAVVTTTPGDTRASFSNHGPQVDVAAPGVDIYSTWPWRERYWTLSGTSMAAPHVSGLAALVWSLAPTWAPDQVRAAILKTAVDIETPGWDAYSGWGRIDADAAVRATLEPAPVLTKTVEPGLSVPGSPLTYTIAVHNIGQPMVGAVLTDALPPQVEFLSAAPPARYEPSRRELVWSQLSLTTGQAITITVRVVLGAGVTPCTPLTNWVQLDHDSLPHPLLAQASHRVLPCVSYLPLIRSGQLAWDRQGPARPLSELFPDSPGAGLVPMPPDR